MSANGRRRGGVCSLAGSEEHAALWGGVDGGADKTNRETSAAEAAGE